MEFPGQPFHCIHIDTCSRHTYPLQSFRSFDPIRSLSSSMKMGHVNGLD